MMIKACFVSSANVVSDASICKAAKQVVHDPSRTWQSSAPSSIQLARHATVPAVRVSTVMMMYDFRSILVAERSVAVAGHL